MDHPNDAFGFLTLALVLLAAAVASVPIARRIGLSAVVAYLVAGIIIGPYGLGVFRTPGSILSVAELGIVMLLFLIGLELELGKLLAMRRAIFGLGAAQLTLTAITIGADGAANVGEQRIAELAREVIERRTRADTFGPDAERAGSDS